MSPRRRPIRRAAIRRGIIAARPPVRAIRRIRRRIWRRTRRLLVGTSILLLVGGSTAVYKMEKSDIEKIERDAGKSAENMTEQEIIMAMRKNGIQNIELTSQDDAVINRFEDEELNNNIGVKFCSHCGKEISVGGSFCPECGSKI